MSTNSRIRAVAKFFFEGDRKFFLKGITYGPFKPDADGMLTIPDRPGLGIELNREALKRFGI